MASRAAQAPAENLDRPALLVFRHPDDSTSPAECAHQARQVSPETPAHRDPQDRRDHSDPEAMLEGLATKVSQDHPEDPESLVAQDNLVVPVTLASLEPEVEKEAPDPKDPVDHAGKKVQVASPVGVEIVETTEVLDHKDLPDQPVPPAPREDPDLPVPSRVLAKMPNTVPALVAIELAVVVEFNRKIRLLHYF